MKKIEEYRKKIDNIDNKLLNLFIERMNIVDKISNIKKDNNIDIVVPDREKNIFNRLYKINNKRINEIFIKEFFSSILNISKHYQKNKEK